MFALNTLPESVGIVTVSFVTLPVFGVIKFEEVVDKLTRPPKEFASQHEVNPDVKDFVRKILREFALAVVEESIVASRSPGQPDPIITHKFLHQAKSLLGLTDDYEK